MVPVFTGTSQPRMQGTSALPMGWALKSAGSKRSRFSATQKSYLTDKFKIGELTKKKVDPASVARSMMTAKNTNGSRLFTSDDFLTATQIANFFSRLASKKTLLDDDLGEQFLDDEDVEAAAVEDELEQMTTEAANELAAKHPLFYDNYNLCELSSKRKLGSFALPVLKDMCKYFGLDVDDIKIRRRKPYVDRLLAICESCTCRK